jgi:two-component system phosphate regulon response regulator PhoB
MPKLLVVEDDEELLRHINAWLSSEKYLVETAQNGEDALQMLNNFNFDVIVLDWNLGGVSGLEVCQKFRKSGGTTPIIFLTGESDINHKELGLNSGADDYLTKPFDERELSARVKSLLRRASGLVSNDLTVKGVTLDIISRTATSGDKKARLSPRETSLLEYLMRHPNRFYSSKALLDSVWPLDSEVSEETVRTCMKTLRHRLSEIGLGDLVKTVLRQGYCIETE